MGIPATILIVDDDASGRAMLSLSLRQAGYRVLTASGGEEALAALEQEDCDCLITDAKMRPMDGFELTSRAKRLRPELRIAMISAVYSENDIRTRPIDRFFPKPVPVDALLDWIAPKGTARSGGSA